MGLIEKYTIILIRGTYEFKENSIVVSIPFAKVPYDDLNSAVTQVATQVTTQVAAQIEMSEKVLKFCSVPRTMKEITDELGFRERKSARKYVHSLIEEGRLVMTIPDKPNSSKQKYVTLK